ncbi:hypothetical protein W02_02410 [Nitrospira sp. KM1]|uniref:DUF4136 domain-containing protein n=1 Tax=Nitrospira sp. KM1 TaxID=1936990 RepID=UPI0013A77CB6|nr:DUF4136 domain-containing protein [Nitrospira sp. KM1]BCA53101.1 hypothetical protein W02_02410 [Nitrospira sp. KM1]
MMNRLGVTWFVACLALSLSACANIDVKTDHDPTVDFAKFQTYAFAGLTEIDKTGVYDNSLMRKRIEAGLSRELEKKGFRRVELADHPDLRVHYWVGIKEKQRIESTGGYYGGMYGWRGGYGWGAGYGGGVQSYDYNEGTLIVDLVEPVKNELVWRATMVAPLEDTTDENLELGRKALEKAFEEYPPKKPSP